MIFTLDSSHSVVKGLLCNMTKAAARAVIPFSLVVQGAFHLSYLLPPFSSSHLILLSLLYPPSQILLSIIRMIHLSLMVIVLNFGTPQLPIKWHVQTV